MRKDIFEWFNIYYSQNKEDLILNTLLSHVDEGFYVDVGAHDPIYFSVTKLFYDKGWSGINIEPQEVYFRKLKKSRSRDINLNCAVDIHEGILTMRQYTDATGLSTLSPGMKDAYISDDQYSTITSRFEDTKVATRPLKSILDQYASGKEIHFLKIDVEGFEPQVINSNDWNKHRPHILCIEANHEQQDWHGLVRDARYSLIFNDGLNQYFVAKEHEKNIRSHFNYAEGVLRKIPLSYTPFDIMTKEIERVHKEYRRLQAFSKTQDDLINKLEAELVHAQKVLSSPAHRIATSLSVERRRKK